MNDDLLFAANWGQQQRIQQLIEDGANPNTVDSFGQTPLLLASKKENTPIVNILLANGVDPNCEDHLKWTPLMWACCKGILAIVEMLLQNGAEFNQPRCSSRRTPLIFAAQQGHKAIVKMLIEYGADVNLCDCDGLTALMKAVTAIMSRLSKCSLRMERMSIVLTMKG